MCKNEPNGPNGPKKTPQLLLAIQIHRDGPNYDPELHAHLKSVVDGKSNRKAWENSMHSMQSGSIHSGSMHSERYIGVPFRVDGFFSLFFALIFDWFQLYIFAVTSCIVHCVTCFFYINLRLSFPTKIEKNGPKITLHAKWDTYQDYYLREHVPHVCLEGEGIAAGVWIDRHNSFESLKWVTRQLIQNSIQIVNWKLSQTGISISKFTTELKNHQVMGKHGNLRANMKIYKVIGDGAPSNTSVVMHTEGNATVMEVSRSV